MSANEIQLLNNPLTPGAKVDVEEQASLSVARILALSGLPSEASFVAQADKKKIEQGKRDYEKYLKWKSEQPPVVPLPTEPERRALVLKAFDRVLRVEKRQSDAAWVSKISKLVEEANSQHAVIVDCDAQLAKLPDPQAVLSEGILPTAKAAFKALPGGFRDFAEAVRWTLDNLPCIEARSSSAAAQHAITQLQRTRNPAVDRFWVLAIKIGRLHFGTKIDGDNLILRQLETMGYED